MKFNKLYFITGVCSLFFTGHLHAEDVLSSIENRVQRFQTRYGIPLIYKGIVGTVNNIQFKLVSPQEYNFLNDYLAMFEEEISKYPLDFFQGREVLLG